MTSAEEPSSSRSLSAAAAAEDVLAQTQQQQQQQLCNFSSVSEIEIADEISSGELFEIKGGVTLDTIKEEADHDQSSLFSYDISNGDDVVYVVVEKSNEVSSMDGLIWTLNNAINPSSTVVYLIHVFPEARYIPSPLGNLPVSQVNQEQLETFMVQERTKRREFLQKFLNTCSASKITVETILIESDMEAKAILDLIPILNIRKLVVGTTKPSLRKIKSKKGSGIADQVLQNAPEFCEVKIICEGKEVIDQMIESPSTRSDEVSPKPAQEQNQIIDTFTCNCFKPKAIA